MADLLVPLSSVSKQPLYNIKAACKRTKLTRATLRAWERRYGVPAPDHARQGYRLYSEHDLAILFWLLQQIEQGLSIGQGARKLQSLLELGQDLQVINPTLISDRMHR